MTVLVVGGSIEVALGIDGAGLISCAVRQTGASTNTSGNNLESKVLIQSQLSLETVGAINGNTILLIIAQWQV